MSLANLRAQAQALADGKAGLKAQELRTAIIQNLSAPGRGRTYARRGISHTASAPGDSPAVDTGRLRQSISVVKLTEGHYRVGTNVSYAPLLEFGTRDIAPRPFLRPALAQARGTP